uniref:Uncharacterized protein n=2 Tax=Candidatus Kentrum sp. LFY TaxID=2126342 RepID=A0A450V740_9GAMM|nr:MAG: hypothetical protein BECKLFY1418A_GA0070994_11212 [Candidatus Kentron sp. LFY]
MAGYRLALVAVIGVAGVGFSCRSMPWPPGSRATAFLLANPAKPEPKFHRMEDMLALRAKTEAGWVLAGALVLSGFLFFRYLEGYVISTRGRNLVHLEFLKPEDFSLRSK